MDPAGPLGARSNLVDVESLTRWNLTQLPKYKGVVTPSGNLKESPFPWRNDLNSKIILWEGDPTTLKVHAVLNSTNETLNDRNPVSEAIYKKGGSDLVHEVIAKLKGCKTGDAKLTKGYDLPARYVIHTVGPRFNVKYKTAAESALYSCYRNVLQISRENGIVTLGLCCIHSARRGYPPEDGAHIAIRTVRRFMEKNGSDFDCVIFVIADEQSKEIYEAFLPLYFPRNTEEEGHAAMHLPIEIGNEDGEPVIEERQIRILGKPTIAAKSLESPNDMEETVDLNREFCTSTVTDIGHHPFAQMDDDLDKTRKQVLHGRSSEERDAWHQEKRYQRLLKRARQTDMSDIAALRCIFLSGVDKIGRPVIVLVGKNFPATDINLDKALLYLLHVMEPVTVKDYVIVYYHTLTNVSNRPDLGFLRTVYNITDNKYRKNLKAFYVVHPTFWSRLATWFFMRFAAADIKNKVQNLPGVEYLFAHIPYDQLDIPQFILDYDFRINGQRYYSPPETASEAL